MRKISSCQGESRAASFAGGDKTRNSEEERREEERREKGGGEKGEGLGRQSVKG